MCMVCGQNTLACESLKQRQVFAKVYGEWLKLRAETEMGDELTDEVNQAMGDRESELAEKLWAMPSAIGYQVLQKVHVLEQYHHKSEWTDQRDLRLIASIKADLQELLG